jgi:hypothetical protein
MSIDAIRSRGRDVLRRWQVEVRQVPAWILPDGVDYILMRGAHVTFTVPLFIGGALAGSTQQTQEGVPIILTTDVATLERMLGEAVTDELMQYVVPLEYEDLKRYFERKSNGGTRC